MLVGSVPLQKGCCVAASLCHSWVNIDGGQPPFSVHLKVELGLLSLPAFVGSMGQSPSFPREVYYLVFYLVGVDGTVL